MQNCQARRSLAELRGAVEAARQEVGRAGEEESFLSGVRRTKEAELDAMRRELGGDRETFAVFRLTEANVDKFGSMFCF